MSVREKLAERRAALLLHGLPPMQRRSVLAKLDTAESERLQQLLNELARLGFSPDLTRQLGLTFPTDSPPPSPRGAQQRVRAMSSTDVARCLEPCAPATVAQFLKSDDWPWKQVALDSMSELRRVDVSRQLGVQSAPLAPAVLQGLCERVCAEAAALADSSELNGLRQVLRRVMKWIR